MTATLHCPDCGSPLPADAPQGECPRCLLQAGFESEPAVAASVATPSVAATRTSAGHSHFVPPSVAELQQRIPQYEILELIGQGGMGAVYKAKQAGLGRSVAIKILPFEVSQSAAFTERFCEARALALLSHPHIVAVHDFGQADGLCYFVMEYVDGVNLRQALQAGKMNPQQALAIVPQICEALQFAHEEGVVHRDIKPENILIDKRGRVKIADFGLAKLLGTDAGPEHSLTGTQQVMGTLRYMAPEQMFGSKEVDHRADIFSLGVVLYELLTGELPIGRFALPSKKSGVDARLDEVVLRALESEPSERYQSVSEMKHGLDSISKLELPALLPAQATAARPAPSSSNLELLLDQTDTSIRIRQHAYLLAGSGLLAVGVLLAFAGVFPQPLALMVPALSLAVGGGLLAMAHLYQQGWEGNWQGHRVVVENGVFTGSRLVINGETVARSSVGFRQEMQGWLPDGSGRRIIAMTESGFLHFRCRLYLQPAVPGVPAPQPGASKRLAGLPAQSPAAQSLRLLLDETDTSIRLRQHGFLLTGFAFFIVAFTVGFGLLGIVPALILLALAACCYALANLEQQRWETNCDGHRVVFENGVLRGSRLYINGQFVARSGIGYVQEIQGLLPDGSGRRIIAVTEAAFLRFRCQLYLQPAVPGVPVPSAAVSPPPVFAGTLPHLVLAIMATLATILFVLYVGEPFLRMLFGPDFALLHLGRQWGIGQTVNSIVSVLFLVFVSLVAVTTYAWGTYRAAVVARNPPSPREYTENKSPRLSRAAIWGAVLSPLFVLGVCLLVVATIPAVVVQRGDEHSPPRSPVMWMMIPFAIVELACLIAPFATTILGIIAIGNIRSSKGKVHGMPLAVFDALLYPLLLLDLVLFALGLFVSSLMISVLFSLLKDDGTVFRVAWVGAFALTAIVFGPLIIWFDIWLIRLTWRAATNGLAAEADDKKLAGLPQKEPPPFQPARSRGTSTTTIVILVLLGLLAIPLLLVCGVAGTWGLHEISPQPSPMKEVDKLYERAPLPEQVPDPIMENTEPAKAP